MMMICRLGFFPFFLPQKKKRVGDVDGDVRCTR